MEFCSILLLNKWCAQITMSDWCANPLFKFKIQSVTNKKTKTPNFSFSRRRTAADLHQTLHEDRGCPYHFCTPPPGFFFISDQYSEETQNILGENAPSAYKFLFTNRIAPNVKNFCTPITRINSTDFTNIWQGVRPCGAKKLAILAVFFWPEPPKYPPVLCAVPNFTLIRESCRPAE